MKIKKYMEFELIKEGKSSHLPNEGDGFSDMLCYIKDAINKELKNLYKKNKNKYDRAGIVIELINTKIGVKAEFVEKCLDDFTQTLNDKKYIDSYSNSELFIYAEELRDRLQEELNNHLESSELKDTFYPDDLFYKDIQKIYNNYKIEHDKTKKYSFKINKNHSIPLNEDFLVCKGGDIEAFYKKIKSKITNHTFKNNVLTFLISGDNATINKYKKLAEPFDVKVKFE